MHTRLLIGILAIVSLGVNSSKNSAEASHPSLAKAAHVWIYDGSNFDGKSARLDVGLYENNYGNGNLPLNDSISSIVVPMGWHVEARDGDSFDRSGRSGHRFEFGPGRHVVKAQTNTKLDNKISYLKIYRGSKYYLSNHNPPSPDRPLRGTNFWFSRCHKETIREVLTAPSGTKLRFEQ